MANLVYVVVTLICAVAVTNALIPSVQSKLCKFRICPAGTMCKETGIVCVKAPCPTTKCVRITKPGRCPNVLGWYHIFRLCHLKPKCRYDSDCKGNFKCCGFCPRVCQPPVFKPKPKPGLCPKLVSLSVSSVLCKAKPQCGVDQDCDGRMKCCGKCPRRCVNPIFIWKG